MQLEQYHITDRIRRQNTRFSAKQQLIADYLIKNYKQAAFCDVGFYVETQVMSFMDSFGAPISMIHALIAEFCQRDMVLTKRRLRDYEEIAKREKLFYP